MFLWKSFQKLSWKTNIVLEIAPRALCWQPAAQWFQADVEIGMLVDRLRMLPYGAWLELRATAASSSWRAVTSQSREFGPRRTSGVSSAQEKLILCKLGRFTFLTMLLLYVILWFSDYNLSWFASSGHPNDTKLQAGSHICNHWNSFSAVLPFESESGIVNSCSGISLKHTVPESKIHESFSVRFCSLMK